MISKLTEKAMKLNASIVESLWAREPYLEPT
jgi:hypothetical protein